MSGNETVQRYYLLDAARGIAALIVLLWHYQHFFMVAPRVLDPGFRRAEQPLYWLLAPFYDSGYYAVDFFFAISGFVFFAKYTKRIGDRVVSISEFVVLRLSRLYPLHLLTLLFVAALQQLCVHLLGGPVVYRINDLHHFVLNLFFASHWGLQLDYSFNAPVWSVSIEVLIYGIFFAVAFVAGTRKAVLILLTVAVCVLAFFGWSSVGVFGPALFGFFATGFLTLLLQASLLTRMGSVVAAAGAAALAILVTVFGPQLLSASQWPFVLCGVVFPLSVVALGALQGAFADVGRRLRVIGDVSYSMYLLHFPVQMVVILLARTGYIAQQEFLGVPMLFAFVGTVFVVGVLSYYLFERPLQDWIRAKLLSRRAGDSVDASSVNLSQYRRPS